MQKEIFIFLYLEIWASFIRISLQIQLPNLHVYFKGGQSQDHGI